MSLILDALRKSEAERQRGQAPGLFVQQALPARRRRSPAAAWGGIALALVAIAALGWFGWQRFGAKQDAPATEAVATETAGPADGATPADAAAPGAVAAPVGAPGDLGPVVDTRPPNEIPASRGSRAMAAAQAAAAATEPTLAPTPAPAAAAPTAAPAPAVDATAASPPADIAPPPAAFAPAATPPPAADDTASLPRLVDLPAGERASLPPLKLSMHVYAEDPAQRFVILDGRRLGEGAALAEGVFVQSIRRDGLVVSVRGQPYWLAR